MRGIGEPVYPERSAAELAECQRHEDLLNRAFDRSVPWWLLCPYDTELLDPSIIAAARTSHPYLLHDGDHGVSDTYRDAPDDHDAPLPEPLAPVVTMRYGGRASLGAVRQFVAVHAADSGLRHARTADLVLAASEIAANSVRHGGGGGTLRAWRDGDACVCELRDDGHIVDPLAGRERPPAEQPGGRGLWLANHVCDLVQVRSSQRGTTVRLHVRP
jgi:anti-sigma regulatory factor (Ser/Thr protein kinase)